MICSTILLAVHSAQLLAYSLSPFRWHVVTSPAITDVMSTSPLHHRCEKVCATWLRGQFLALTYLAVQAEPKGSTSRAVLLPQSV